MKSDCNTNLIESTKMGYPYTTGSRSFRCNGDLLRYYRDRRGMTQSQLATESGYSVRLIGKAEAGLPIRMETVEVLAETLSNSGSVLSPVDLMTDPVALAKKYVFEQYLKKQNFVGRVEHFLSRSFELRVIADVERLGLSSIYRGASGLGEYCRRLYTSVESLPRIADSMRSQFYALGNEVVVWYQPANRPQKDQSSFLFRPISKLRFSGGLLVEQEDRISLGSCSFQG